jgi:hypothetical protein
VLRPLVILVLAALLVAGCGSRDPESGREVSDPDEGASAPLRPVDAKQNSSVGERDAPVLAPSDATRGGVRFGTAVTTMSGCQALRGVECFEPTAVADPSGRLFSAPGGGPAFMASLDGGLTWAERAAPPEHPQLLTPLRFGDNQLQVDGQGRLWFSRLAYPDIDVGQNVGGLQVSRSDDGGLSWAVDHSFALDLSPDPIVAADRQWLAFAPDGTVYLQFWQYIPGVLWLAASDDDGQSFGPFLRSPAGLTGAGMVSADGVYHVAYFTSTGGYSVMLASTADHGLSWTTEALYAAPFGTGVATSQIFLAIDDAGSFHVSWAEATGRVLVLSGRPGAWGAPTQWSVREAVPASPYLHVHDGVLDLLWFEFNGTGQDVVFAWAPLETIGEGPVERITVETLPKPDKVTDFAWLHATPDGRAVVTWTHHELGVRVALEATR